MFEASESPKGYRFPKLIISYAIYLYHRFLLSLRSPPSGDRDVQELLFERGIDVSHKTVHAWYHPFGPAIAQALRRQKPRRSRNWQLDEVRVVISGAVHWLWRAINEHGEVLDVLLQEKRDTGAAQRFFRRLINDQELPERIVTDGLRSYGAALRELPELGASEHVTVSAAERRNNLIEQSHRPTREQKRQQRGFRATTITKRFLFAHSKLSNLFRQCRGSTPAPLRRRYLTHGFAQWRELGMAIP